MIPEQLYQDLKELAEKLGVSVLEHNFRNTGISVTSGFCKVKGKKVLILDKHRTLNDKNETLLNCLSEMPHEDIYIIPYLRELLNKYSKKKD
jgi:hypothetical protein